MMEEVNFKNIFDSIFNITIDNRTLNELVYTLDEYNDFLGILNELSHEQLLQYEDAMKYEEKLMTQKLEVTNEKKLIDALVSKNNRKDSIEYITEKQLKYGNIIIPNIKRVHSILLDGISFEYEKNKKFRMIDVFVGYFENGEKVIQYIPPKPDKIDDSMKMIIDFLNSKEYSKDIDMLIHPFIVHALVAILQPFNDGNTRVGRLIQSTKILFNTNNLYKYNYQSSPLYLSREYSGFRDSYRDIIKDIAINPNDENWNKWFMFNLYRVQDRINYSIDFIQNRMKIDSGRKY